MESLGRYEILRELGRGGMATVYLARQRDLGRLVALKELGVLRATDGTLAQRFLREARLAGSLSHPNVVTVHDYFEYDGTPFIAMEYVSGGSLRAHMAAGRSTAQIAGSLQGVLAGLSAAGAVGIVHRDLKPENVLVTDAGTVKIADFGIARAGDRLLETHALTKTGTTLGTPDYMAPEQALGEPVSPRTDLYAVGVLAFELLIGRTPFADTETPVAVLMRQVSDPIPPVASVRPDVDPRLSDWIDRLLAKDPADRTPSAEVAAEELDEIVLALLGPRWARESRLPVAAAIEPEPFVPRRRDTPPTRRLRTTGSVAAVGSTVADDAGGPTLAPRAAAPVRGPRPRRFSRLVIAALVIVAVAATLAAAAGRGGAPPADDPVAPAASHFGRSEDSSRTSRGSDPTTSDSSASTSRSSGTRSGSSTTTPGSSASGDDDGDSSAADEGGDSQGAATAPASRMAPSGGDDEEGDDEGGDSQGAATAPASRMAPAGGDDEEGDDEGGENADDGGDGGGTEGGGDGENADDGGDGP
jgi:serine/threonine protein kinase